MLFLAWTGLETAFFCGIIKYIFLRMKNQGRKLFPYISIVDFI